MAGIGRGLSGEANHPPASARRPSPASVPFSPTRSFRSPRFRSTPASSPANVPEAQVPPTTQFAPFRFEPCQRKTISDFARNALTCLAPCGKSRLRHAIAVVVRRHCGRDDGGDASLAGAFGAGCSGSSAIRRFFACRAAARRAINGSVRRRLRRRAARARWFRSWRSSPRCWRSPWRGGGPVRHGLLRPRAATAVATSTPPPPATTSGRTTTARRRRTGAARRPLTDVPKAVVSVAPRLTRASRRCAPPTATGRCAATRRPGAQQRAVRADAIRHRRGPRQCRPDGDRAEDGRREVPDHAGAGAARRAAALGPRPQDRQHRSRPRRFRPLPAERLRRRSDPRGQAPQQLETGKTATFIIFQTPEEGIGIPISLNGFADGYEALP